MPAAGACGNIDEQGSRKQGSSRKLDSLQDVVDKQGVQDAWAQKGKVAQRVVENGHAKNRNRRLEKKTNE